MPYKDPEVRKAKAKEYSRKHYLKNKKKVIERTKKRKEKTREREREYRKKARRRKDPSLRISDAISDLSRGKCGLDEFNRRVQRAIDEVNEKRKNRSLGENKDSA